MKAFNEEKALLMALRKILSVARPRSKIFFNIKYYIYIHTYVIYVKLQYICTFSKHDWLYHLITSSYQNYYKGGQLTKPLIVVKIYHKYIIIACHSNIFAKVTSWPQLISKFLVAPTCFHCCF